MKPKMPWDFTGPNFREDTIWVSPNWAEDQKFKPTNEKFEMQYLNEFSKEPLKYFLARCYHHLTEDKDKKKERQMSTELNFIKAKREWAYPLYINISQEIRNIFLDVIKEYDGVHQKSDTSIPILNGFKERIQSQDKHEIQQAAQIIHYTGWWGGHDEFCLQYPKEHHGSYWKFELLVDQIVGSGDKIKVPEKYYEHKDGSSFDDDEIIKILKPQLSELFTVMSVMDVNYKPHIPMIGLETMKYAKRKNSPFLTGEAPCSHPGCDLKIKDHTSDHIIFIKRKQVDGSKFTQEEKDLLRKIVPEMEKYGCDGFAFISNKEGE